MTLILEIATGIVLGLLMLPFIPWILVGGVILAFVAAPAIVVYVQYGSFPAASLCFLFTVLLFAASVRSKRLTR